VHRSPSYPLFDLGAAVAKTKLVYDHDKRAAVSADVIAGHLGYSAAKGLGGRAVSALKQYGLLEEVSGKYRISEWGYVLVHYDRNSPEWINAATEAARHPVLFRELLEENPNGLPSDAGLRNDLLKRGFNPGAIAEVVSIVRNTMSFASGEETVYNGNTENEMPEVQTATEVVKPLVVDDRPRPRTMLETQKAAGQLAGQAPAGYRHDVFSLAEGTVTIQWPVALSPESYEDLGDWLDILKRKIGRSVKAEPVNFGDLSAYKKDA
jgi:hypothetical protein